MRLEFQCSIPSLIGFLVSLEEFKLKYPGKPYLDTEKTQFADLLKRGCLAVVRSSYFEKQAANKSPFQDRQSIPEEFFIRDEELQNGSTGSQ